MDVHCRLWAVKGADIGIELQVCSVKNHQSWVEEAENSKIALQNPKLHCKKQSKLRQLRIVKFHCKNCIVKSHRSWGSWELKLRQLRIEIAKLHCKISRSWDNEKAPRIAKNHIRQDSWIPLLLPPSSSRPQVTTFPSLVTAQKAIVVEAVNCMLLSWSWMSSLSPPWE